MWLGMLLIVSSFIIFPSVVFLQVVQLIVKIADQVHLLQLIFQKIIINKSLSGSYSEAGADSCLECPIGESSQVFYFFLGWFDHKV